MSDNKLVCKAYSEWEVHSLLIQSIILLFLLVKEQQKKKSLSKSQASHTCKQVAVKLQQSSKMPMMLLLLFAHPSLQNLTQRKEQTQAATRDVRGGWRGTWSCTLGSGTV